MFGESSVAMNSIPGIAVFASGNGSNAQRLAEFFQLDGSAAVRVIYSNKPGAYVLERARMLGIPSAVFSRQSFYESQELLKDLESRSIDWIVLAGFLWLIPDYLLKAYRGRIINIHPALLPGFGGKGMYGAKVHEAVIATGEKESGITIHYVNENYDEGRVICQARCVVDPHDTPDSLAHKIHELEYKYYPEVIKGLVTGTSSL